jgi:hypothetical protein
MDPFDGFKRWYRELWPMQRVGVWLCAAVIVWLLRPSGSRGESEQRAEKPRDPKGYRVKSFWLTDWV